MEKEYRNVEVQINTTVKNVSSTLSDEDVISFVENSLKKAFGLYIDRKDIIIKEAVNA